MRTHYDTLGISPKATTDEIKAAFRKLSLETHPDVAGPGQADRFKEISQAASVLTNPTQRQAYDNRLQRPLGSVRNDAWGDRPIHRPTGPRPIHGWQVFLQTIFRPRNMILGSIAVYTTVTTARHYFGYNNDNHRYARHNHNNTSKVQAWKNPTTGEWEQPAPWDPTYRRLQPRLTLVPREQVKTRTR